MEFKDQKERIEHYEELLNSTAEAVAFLGAALDAFSEAKPAMEELSDYYGSDEWKQDFADDEAGLIPKDLPRGVLSEDGIYNVLEEAKMLLNEMQELAKDR